MSRATPPSRESRFWDWFQKNSDQLFQLEADQPALLEELSAQLNRVYRGLTFELGPVEDGKREFIVSADGIRDRFPAVRRLVDAAPAMPNWTVIAFRPPKDFDVVVEIGSQRLGSDDVWFSSQPDRDRTGLALYIRGLTKRNEPLLAQAAFILLDSALGEYDVETLIGTVKLYPLPPDPAVRGLRPFREIRQVFGETS